MEFLKKVFRVIMKPARRHGFLIAVIGAVIAVCALFSNSAAAAMGFFALGVALGVYGAIGIVVNLISRFSRRLGGGNRTASATAHSSAPRSSAKNNRRSSDTVTLTSSTGEEIEFNEIAGIKYGGNFYAILQPVELLEGMSDNEALVFKVKRGYNGEDNFEIELDDNIIAGVFREYDRLYDEARR